MLSGCSLSQLFVSTAVAFLPVLIRSVFRLHLDQAAAILFYFFGGTWFALPPHAREYFIWRMPSCQFANVQSVAVLGWIPNGLNWSHFGLVLHFGLPLDRLLFGALSIQYRIASRGGSPSQCPENNRTFCFFLERDSALVLCPSALPLVDSAHLSFILHL